MIAAPPPAALRRALASRRGRGTSAGGPLALLLTVSLAACGAGEVGPAHDVGIDGAYLIQGSQDYAGTVPLVRGRNGLFRVFVRARRAGLVAPAVRAHLHDAAGTLLRTYQETTVPPPVTLLTEVDEGSLAASWNFAIPGDDLRPGRYLVAEMDPVAGVSASQTRSLFRYPGAGALDVRDVPALALTVIPVVQAPPGQPPLVPLVSGQEPGGGLRTLDSWLDRASRVHPLLTVEVRLGATYTTATTLGADGSGWTTLLSELEQKRLVDGSPNSYLGAVHVEYLEGTNGIAYAPPAPRPSSALAWDAGSTLDIPSYQRVAAHEVGHLLGLLHAPCGSPMPPGVDPGWPLGPTYGGAHIGAYGWDPLDGSLKSPAEVFDHMSYCGTYATTWSSDYEYRRVLDRLAGAPAGVASSSPVPAARKAGTARQPCLIVAGRLRDGAVALEPAYLADTFPSPPSPGDYGLDLLGADGMALTSVSFEPTLVPEERHGDGAEHHFAMALPLDADVANRLRGLAVRERGTVIHRRLVTSDAAAVAPVRATRLARHAQLHWDAQTHAGAMVRDPRTGEVLAFLRGGEGSLRTDAPELDVVLSDGVRSGPPVRLAP